jgi:hypothetical protein
MPEEEDIYSVFDPLLKKGGKKSTEVLPSRHKQRITNTGLPPPKW